MDSEFGENCFVSKQHSKFKLEAIQKYKARYLVSSFFNKVLLEN